MKHFSKTFKLAIAVVTLWLPCSLYAQSTVIDDFEDGNSQNELGDLYWYFYADKANNGTSEVLSADEVGASLVFRQNEYTPGYQSEYCALLHYDLDDKDTIQSQVAPYVAMGTNLAPTGEEIDLTGATKITFYARSDAAMNVRVKLEMSHCGDNKYQIVTGDTYGISVTEEWTQYEMILSGLDGNLDQEDWGPKYTGYVDMDLSLVTNLVFEIKRELDNPDVGEFYVDDVIIEGIELTPVDVREDLIGPAGAGTGAVLSDFEGEWPNANARDYYWYCYNDAGGRNLAVDEEFSTIFDGVAADSDPEEPELLIDGNGFDATNGAYIGFQFGPTYEDNGNEIDPFVGLGTMLSGNFGTDLFDADAIGATGVYFDYKTDANVSVVVLEMSDAMNRGNPGLVHHVKLPGTDGEWKGASVPFNELGLPNWDEVNSLLPDERVLSTTEITKMQWKISGDEGGEGALYIDNLIMLGAPADAFTSVRHRIALARSGMQVNRTAGALKVALEPKAQDVSLSIVSPQGRLVAKRTIKAGATSATLSVNNLADGLYIVNITGLENRTFSMPMTIVK